MVSRQRYKNKVKADIIVVFLCLFSRLVFSEPILAPVNPEFVKYLQDYRLGKITTKTDGYRLGYIPPPVTLSHLKGKIGVPFALPSSYDLRSLGKVTPVKDQDPYGTCWAFASYASLESCLLPAETRDFSENNLVNLHGFDPGFNNGGNCFMSTAYLARWSGPINESDDIYPKPGGSLPGLPVQKHIQNVQFLPPRSGPLDNNTIKQAVMEKGAVCTAFYWEDPYYNSSSYAYYYNGGKSSNHAVAIVGWDDNFSKTNFNSIPPGDGAFILKNSWGTAWGDQGYFYISYYDTQLGKDEDNAVFYNAEPVTNYGYIYQYDPLGWVDNVGYSSNTAWFANIFNSLQNEEIKAIGFYVPQVNSTYEVRIYTNVSAGQPTSGSLAASKSGVISMPGYHTIMLDSPVPLTLEEKFSVVVKLTTPGYNYPITIEMPWVDYSSNATAISGQSYVSKYGTTWSDITADYPDTNVCLKVYTDIITPQPPIEVYDTSGEFVGTYTTIQQGINACPNGGKVLVPTGVYNEAIYIKKRIALIGNGSNSTTIIASGLVSTSTVTFDGSNANGTITGFTITGAGYDGIYCSHSSPQITNNTISGNRWGIYCSSSSPTITNNTISGNDDDGIYCSS
ncbi:MAG: lectin like domain-containing protein, partial [bacterium]